MLRSLTIRNFRLFFYGQMVSASGVWMQNVGLAWLVLELGGSGTDVGVVVGLNWLPLAAIGSWAGVIVDRSRKRVLLLGTNLALSCVAATLAAVVVLDVATLGVIYLISFAYGLGLAFENPTRRAFLAELVDGDTIANAVSLNSSLMATARALGPMAGGALIAAAGVEGAFIANAASYAAIIVALLRMDPGELHIEPPVPRQPRQLIEGLRYVRLTAEVRRPLASVAVVGLVAFNHAVLIPLIVTDSFGGGPLMLGLMLGSLSVGSIIGGLQAASRTRIDGRTFVGSILFFGLTVASVAAATAPWVLGVLLFLMGIGATSFTSVANALLQRDTAKPMLGRVLALYSVAFLGSSGVGSPLIGAAADIISPRAGFLIGGLVTVACAGVLHYTTH